jgi:AAA15 family ATPase/GTPase
VIKLKSVTIHKYKCIENDNSFEVDDKVTCLVGMNESGKTSILEALAKTNYFEKDGKFKLNKTHDYPRKEKKEIDKAGSTPKAVTCRFFITDELVKLIEDDIGKGVLTNREFTQSYDYKNLKQWTYINSNTAKFVAEATNKLGISSEALNAKLVKVKNAADIDKLISEYKDEEKKKGINAIRKYFENEPKWLYPLDEYIVRTYLNPRMPKFLYYDEYYALPSRISIEKLQSKELDENELKTAKALFELADIDIDELLNADDFEDLQAELEATEAIITEELFKYWSTNSNLDI